MNTLDLVTLFLESSKDRFINKLNITDKEKQELKDFCDKYPQYASRINWQKRDLTWEDIKPILELPSQSKSAKKRQAKNDPKALFQKGSLIIYKETEDWLYVLPQSWEDAKFIDSSACGGEGAKWCIGWKDSPAYWKSYTSGEESDETSSFILAFNKNYDPHILDNVPRVTITDSEGNSIKVPDPFNKTYQKAANEGKLLKYMIQVLDDPEYQTGVHGADEVYDKCGYYDHIVWTQDDKLDNVIPLSNFKHMLSDADIQTVKRIFDKKFRLIDEDAINNMPTIVVSPETIDSIFADLPKNNANCPLKIVFSGNIIRLPNIDRFIEVSFENNCTINTALLKTLKGIDKVVDIDWSSLSSANVEGPYKDLKKLNIMPNLSNMSLLDYFFAYTEQDTLILTNTVFNNLEHARYTFFGAKIDHLDLSGCDFLKLKSAIRCFDNASIDTLDMTDVQFSDSMDFEDMFTNHKIRTLITDNPQVQQAFDKA